MQKKKIKKNAKSNQVTKTENIVILQKEIKRVGK